MRRRQILKGLAAASLLPALPLSARTAPVSRSRLVARVRPSDPAWPRPAEWARLKEAVGGNLIEPRALFAACESSPQSLACRALEKDFRNPFFIGDQPAGTEVSGWLDAWRPAPSAYAVKARHAADVAAAVNFAREKRLRLVVKGGGHSYQGTSNAPDSLLIWTRAMNQVTLHDAFVPRGCPGSQPVPAVSAGAGAMWIDLYHAVTTRAGRYVQGGGCTSVGTAGLVQSGGFGSFSKGFGTAAAHLLEAEVVTADGQVRTVNACRDPDLFWALKGGGGGSWGVVTRQTLRTFELPEYFGAAWGRIRARTDAAFRQLIARFLEHYAGHLLNAHWGEQAHFAPDNTLTLSMVCQGLDAAEVKAAWDPFFAWVLAAGQELEVTDALASHVVPARHWWDVIGNPSMIRDPRPGTPAWHGWWTGDWGQVGAFIHGYDSLWLPAALLRPDRQASLTEGLFAASRHKRLQLHFNKGIAGAGAEAIAATRATATNPAVLEAFVLVIIADGGKPAYPGMPGAAIDPTAAHEDADRIAAAARELRKLVPDAGSYVSESNYFDPRWQASYWGGNYPRLRAVKARFDPQGLFFGHNGVGSEDWSADGFTPHA